MIKLGLGLFGGLRQAVIYVDPYGHERDIVLEACGTRNLDVIEVYSEPFAMRQLSLLGNRHQLRYQLLRHCGAALATHLRRQVRPDILEKYVEPLTAAIDDELAAITMVPGDDEFFQAYGMPPPCATSLPERARTRAYMPVSWGGCAGWVCGPWPQRRSSTGSRGRH